MAARSLGETKMLAGVLQRLRSSPNFGFTLRYFGAPRLRGKGKWTPDNYTKIMFQKSAWSTSAIPGVSPDEALKGGHFHGLLSFFFPPCTRVLAHEEGNIWCTRSFHAIGSPIFKSSLCYLATRDCGHPSRPWLQVLPARCTACPRFGDQRSVGGRPCSECFNFTGRERAYGLKETAFAW